MKRINPFLDNDYSFSQGCSFQKEEPQPEIDKLKEALNTVHFRATTAITRSTEALIEINDLKAEVIRLATVVDRLMELIIKKDQGKL